MKLITLMENTTTRDDLVCEHGLSLYIEAGDLRILFGAGQSAAFADNAEKLGVDLSAVDLCILSHGHYDHGGGIARFLEVNDHAPVYVSRHAFGDFYNAEGKYIGLDSALPAIPAVCAWSARASASRTTSSTSSICSSARAKSASSSAAAATGA